MELCRSLTMNYPKPQKYEHAAARAPEYLSVPQYRHEIEGDPNKVITIKLPNLSEAELFKMRNFLRMHQLMFDDTRNVMDADIKAIQMYLQMGFDKQEAFKTFVHVFEDRFSPSKVHRISTIQKYINDFNKPEAIKLTFKKRLEVIWAWLKDVFTI